jgi:hygromycin-B 7''-O-kinase
MTTWNAPHFEPPNSIRDAAHLAHWRQAAELTAQRHNITDNLLGMAESGSDVVLRGERYFFKMTAPHFRSELSAERELLTHVAGRLPVATPKIVAAGELEGWPYLWMTKVDGTPLAKIWPSLTHEARLDIAAQLGELVAALHRLPLFGDAAGWPALLQHFVDSAPTRHTKPTVPATLSENVAGFLSRVLRPEAPLVLLHTEVLDEHVFASFEGARWKLSAMLDFADGRVGHPEYEFPALVEFIFRGEPGLLEAFLHAYGWGPAMLTNYSERLLAWGLIHQFGSLPRMLRVLGEPLPASLEELASRLYQ